MSKGVRGALLFRTAEHVIHATSSSASGGYGVGVDVGVHRSLIVGKLAPPSTLQTRYPLFFSSQTKDKRLEAIQKSQQLHAELKEVT